MDYLTGMAWPADFNHCDDFDDDLVLLDLQKISATCSGRER